MKKTFSALRGFTLMETLLAVALVGVMLSIFLTVFVPARGLVRRALTRQEAERITSVLRAEINTLRPDEIGNKSSSNKYRTPFEKGFYWLKKTARPGTSIVIFSYRADLSKAPRPDGTYPAVPANKAVPGKNMQLVTLACPLDDPIHRNDIRDAVGPVFLVKMSQLTKKENGRYETVLTPGHVKEAAGPAEYVSAPGDAEAWGGVLFCRADFYLMSSPNPDRYKGKKWEKLGSPIFSANLSFRR